MLLEVYSIVLKGLNKYNKVTYFTYESLSCFAEIPILGLK